MTDRLLPPPPQFSETTKSGQVEHFVADHPQPSSPTRHIFHCNLFYLSADGWPWKTLLQWNEINLCISEATFLLFSRCVVEEEEEERE